MGNSSSLHTINWDSSAAGGLANGRSKSELNGYFQNPRHNRATSQDNDEQTQSLLRRQTNQSNQRTGQRTRSLQALAATEQFKVLPKISVDRHKLRPTSNGMLLHAGGTISGRHKDDLRVPGLMQRSRTFIFNGDDGKKSVETIEPPSFQRSQTLLHFPSKEKSKEEQEINHKKFPQHTKGESSNHHRNSSSSSSIGNHNLRNARSEPDFRNDLNKPTHARKTGLMDTANVVASTTTNKKTTTTATTIITTATATATTTTTKLNKYNKKRKAPPAPSAAKTPHNIERAMGNAMENVVPEKATMTRRFRTNANNKPHQQQQQQARQQPTPTASIAHPIFRREKSCDAILLRSKNESQDTTTKETRLSAGSKIAETIRHESTKTNTNSNAPKQASKIPQLKRTFYFGMQVTEAEVKHPTTEIAQRKNMLLQKRPVEEQKCDDMTELNAQPYRLAKATEHAQQHSDRVVKNEESEINDNGILVHIRPALPRRQLEVPSFSPAAAWRMLINVEEDKHKQAQRSTSNGLNRESPIQLKSNKLVLEIEEMRREQPALMQNPLQKKDSPHCMTWTPQQDLGDDDDDGDDNDDGGGGGAGAGANNGINNDTSSSDDFDDGSKDEEDGLLFFNGNTKKGRNSTATTKEKNSSLGVHMFSLSLPRETHLDAHSQKKNFITSNGNDRLNGFSSLQKFKLSISGGNRCTCRTSESQTELEFCEIHSCQSMLRSDNWMMVHRTGNKEGASKPLTGNNGKLLKNDITSTMEPVSLSYLTGGKHKMYLPGITNSSSKDDDSDDRNRKEKTPTQVEPQRIVSRQRQRKKESRESLQDEIPVFLGDPPAQAPQQQTHRFSFQSTVRLLEKRREAEKLSRDAEIREAQRKSELEAMKRVEEDFQRKRASEKANIRHQLRLFCDTAGGADDNNAMSNNRELYNSLPALMNSVRQRHDSNNNKISSRRAEPDGAAASPSPTFLVDTDPHRFMHEISHLPLKRKDIGNDVDSDNDDPNSDVAHFDRTASMVEPYLQSFMK